MIQYLVESKYCCKVGGAMVYVDSSGFELRAILKHNNNRLRGLLTDTQLFVWSRIGLAHAQMLERLKFDGEVLPDEPKPISIKIMLHDQHMDFFAYGKDLDRLLKNPILIKLVKSDPEHNHILEM